LRWKYRRTEAERRINRGLRIYTASGQNDKNLPASLAA
jgi:hypothetical protein